MLNFCHYAWRRCIKMGIPSLNSIVYNVLVVFHQKYLHEVIQVTVQDCLGI